MLNIITPTDTKDIPCDFAVFLAGTIEMGTARKWQKIVVDNMRNGLSKEILKNVTINFYNPYRDDWDDTWGNTISDENFNKQVTWEWKKLHSCDFIIFNFEKDSKSPISLLELGAMAALKKNILICCPKGFWKYGNVEFISDWYKLKLIHSLDELTADLFLELLTK